MAGSIPAKVHNPTVFETKCYISYHTTIYYLHPVLLPSLPVFVSACGQCLGFVVHSHCVRSLRVIVAHGCFAPSLRAVVVRLRCAWSLRATVACSRVAPSLRTVIVIVCYGGRLCAIVVCSRPFARGRCAIAVVSAWSLCTVAVRGRYAWLSYATVCHHVSSLHIIVSCLCL